MEEEFGPPVELACCEHCSRKFAVDRLEKHQKACTVAKPTKRKAFNAQVARWAATGAEDVLKFLALAKKNGAADKDKKDDSSNRQQQKWRRQSAQLRQIAQANKVATPREGEDASSGPPPVATIDPALLQDDDRVECPHCNRRFVSAPRRRAATFCAPRNGKRARPSAASPSGGVGWWWAHPAPRACTAAAQAPVAHERHVLKCKDIRAKPTTLVRGKSAGAARRPVASSAPAASDACAPCDDDEEEGSARGAPVPPLPLGSVKHQTAPRAEPSPKAAAKAGGGSRRVAPPAGG
eukprot:5190152-Prymnesium_polylepis.1